MPRHSPLSRAVDDIVLIKPIPHSCSTLPSLYPREALSHVWCTLPRSGSRRSHRTRMPFPCPCRCCTLPRAPLLHPVSAQRDVNGPQWSTEGGQMDGQDAWPAVTPPKLLISTGATGCLHCTPSVDGGTFEAALLDYETSLTVRPTNQQRLAL